MKAYFIAILTLFTCIATVVRAQQMSELENRIDSPHGKKTVGIAVWTDKETCSGITTIHFPCSVYSNSMWHWPYWTRWINSISLDSIVSIRHPKCPIPPQPLRKVSRPDFHVGRNWCNTAFPKRQQSLRHLDRICRRHQTYQWLYPPVEYRLLQPLETKTACTPASGAVYRNWSTPSAMVRLLRTADEKVVLQQGAERLLVADHDRYWNRCQQTTKGMLPAKTVVGHKTSLFHYIKPYENFLNNDAGLVIFPTTGNTHCRLRHGLIRDGWGQCEHHRISRMVYDAMRWGRQGLLVAPPWRFWYSGISCRKV